MIDYIIFKLNVLLVEQAHSDSKNGVEYISKTSAYIDLIKLLKTMKELEYEILEQKN